MNWLLILGILAVGIGLGLLVALVWFMFTFKDFMG